MEQDENRTPQQTPKLVTIAGMPQPLEPPDKAPDDTLVTVLPPTVIGPPVDAKKLMVGAGVCLAVIVVALFLAWDALTMRLAPKVYLRSAYERTQKTTQEELEQLKPHLNPVLVDSTAKPRRHTVSLTLPEGNPYPGSYNGELLLDGEAETLLLHLTADVPELLELDGTIYQSPEMMAIQALPLLDHFLTIDPRTLAEDYNSGPMGQYNTLPADFTIGYDFTKPEASTLTPEETLALQREFGPALDRLIERASVGYDGKETVTAGSHSYTGDFFTLTLSEENARTTLIEMFYLIYDNDVSWEILSRQMVADGMTRQQADAMRDELLGELTRAIGSLSIPGGITARIGVSDNKCIDYIEIDFPIEEDGTFFNLAITELVTGERYRTNGFYINMAIKTEIRGMPTGKMSVGMEMDFANNLGESAPRTTSLEMKLDIMSLYKATVTGHTRNDPYMAEGDNFTAELNIDIPLVLTLDADVTGRTDTDVEADTFTFQNGRVTVDSLPGPLMGDAMPPIGLDMNFDYRLAPAAPEDFALPADAEQVALFSLPDEEQLAAIDTAYEAIGMFAMIPMYLLANLAD